MAHSSKNSQAYRDYLQSQTLRGNTMHSNTFDSYWRLEFFSHIPKAKILDHLRQLGYNKAKGSMTNSMLVKILWRQARGLICYDNCSNDELRKFAHDRNLSARFHRNALLSRKDRGMLIQALETRDEEPIFNKFVDLSAELRVRVYEWYIAAFPTTLKFPTTPPLARASRLYRQEFLPVFYAIVEFELYIREYRIRDSPQFSETEPTLLFLSRLNPVDIGRIRKLKLVFQRYQMDAYAHEREVLCRIDLGKNDDAPKVVVEEREWDSHWRLIRWWGSEARVELENGLRRLLSGLKVVEGRRRFMLEDIQGLRDVVQATAQFFAQ